MYTTSTFYYQIALLCRNLCSEEPDKEASGTKVVIIKNSAGPSMDANMSLMERQESNKQQEDHYMDLNMPETVNKRDNTWRPG